jgi:hypothetical protein
MISGVPPEALAEDRRGWRDVPHGTVGRAPRLRNGPGSRRHARGSVDQSQSNAVFERRRERPARDLADHDVLGVQHHVTSSYGTTVGFDSIAVALLGRSNPVGVLFSALLFGAMRSGAPLMQISAGIPAQLVDVLQATILLFLVATPVLQRVFRIRGAKTGIDAPGTFTKTYVSGEVPAA